MHTKSFCHRLFAFLAGVLMLAVTGAASADPSSRVARLSYAQGVVSFSPVGENDWVEAVLNRPMTTGDRIWADADARAEIQDGSAMIRLHSNTLVSVRELDDSMTQLQLTQGVLNVRVRHLAPGQVLEIDTPYLAFTMRQSGDFRMAVDPASNATEVTVREGQGEVTGQGADYLVNAQQRYRFSGPDLRYYEFFNAPRPDAFDQWADQRDRVFDDSESARYVSPGVIGYQDLDANGHWRYDQTYGNVWVPNVVSADWAPYRDGHWSWIEPWGWTWVDDAPWGFAVSHYGRWAHIDRTWCWVPGPRGGAAFYAPALVVFVGGDNFRLSLSGGNAAGIGWFALAPHEPYRPAYSVSHSYFENINRSNTVINETVINLSYNAHANEHEHDYANRRVPGAIVAVPRNVFVQSQPVFNARVHVDHDRLDRAPLQAVPAPAPSRDRFFGQPQPYAPHPGQPHDAPVHNDLRTMPVAPQRAPGLQETVRQQGFPKVPATPTRQQEYEQAPRVQLPIAAPAESTPVERNNHPQPMRVFGQPEPQARGDWPVQPPQVPSQRAPVQESKPVVPMAVPLPQVPTAPRFDHSRATRPESAASRPGEVEQTHGRTRREDGRRKAMNE